MNTIGHGSGGLLHYLVRMCAVIGGVLSVTRMADKIVHAIMVRTGVVVMESSSKARRTSSIGGSYPGSARSSLPGDATAYVSGSRPYGSFPVRTSSTGYSNSSGGGAIIGPGSHPLSRFNSGMTMSSNGMVSAHSSFGGSGSSGPLYSAGSLGGALPHSSNGNGNPVMGDAFSQGGSTNSRPSSGGPPSAGGAPPTANGHVTHLIGPGGGSGSFGGAASQAMGLTQRQGSAGGAVGSPMAGYGPLMGGSRLASATGPMGSGMLGKVGAPGQQYNNIGK